MVFHQKEIYEKVIDGRKKGKSIQKYKKRWYKTTKTTSHK
jgi:hypothetical protein